MPIRKIAFFAVSIGVPLTAYVGLSIYKWIKNMKHVRIAPEELIQKNNNPNVTIVEKWSDWELIAPEFIRNCEKDLVIGLDCEWTKKSMLVSLLQLATINGKSVLIRLCNFHPPCDFPKDLLDLLLNKRILKVGVNIHYDNMKLYESHNLEVYSCRDLGTIENNLLRKDFSSHSLKGLAKFYLGVELNKSLAIVCSDWDAPILSQAQIDYASMDALVGVQIFYKLVDRKFGSQQWRKSETVPWSSPSFTFCHQ